MAFWLRNATERAVEALKRMFARGGPNTVAAARVRRSSQLNLPTQLSIEFCRHKAKLSLPDTANRHSPHRVF
jgi:hypothetical protein